MSDETRDIGYTELFGTEDHREGVRSFLEKREPQYVGR